jgi:hypothetical protein
MNELKLYLETLAKKIAWYDDEDFSPSDYAGGNYDDAYSGGCDDGEINLARELLAKYF